jgi:hypothetical protein
MNLSPKNKEILLSEFELILPKFKTNIELGKKLYYFSAIFGMIQHLLNIEYDDSLVYLHHVLQSTHLAFSSRLSAISKNAEKPIKISDQMIDKLF